MKYIIRDDNIPEISSNEDGQLLGEKLKKEYPYIHDSMEVEGYTIRFNEFSIFHEILSEGKVVGFMTCIHSLGSNLSVNEAFILPEFRHNNLFLEEITGLLMSGADLSFNEPTRNLIELLIHVNLAVKLNDNLVASAIGLDISEEHVIYHGDFDISEKFFSTNLYDINLCSPLLLHDISTPGVCHILYQEAQSWDDVHFGCSEFRKSTDMDDYFNSLKTDFLKNHMEYAQHLKAVKDKLPMGAMNYETILADDYDGLSEYVWSLIDSDVLDKDEASRIINQLRREYDEGIVSDEGLLIRLTYLVEGTDLSQIDELFLENISQTTDLCPCCYQPVNRTDNYCMVCGYDFSDGKLLDYEKVIAEMVQKNDNVLDLRGDKLDEFIDSGNVPVSGDDEIFELLCEIYHNNDIEAFEKLKEDYPLEINDISEIGDLEDRLAVDLSYFFMEDDVEYMKNYYGSCRIVDRMNPPEAHKLNEGMISKNPTYSIRMALIELEKNPNLNEALDNADLKIDKETVRSFLINMDLIESQTFGDDFWVHVYHDYRVVDLKEILRKNSLKVSGNKFDLVLRLKENGMYEEFGEEEFQLTENAEYFLNGTQWINMYNDFMDSFDLDDVQDYLKTKSGTFTENALDYLKEHIKIGYRKRDFRRLHDAFSSMALIHVHDEEFKKALACELQLYMLRMNPIYLTDDEMGSFEAFMYSNMNNIKVLMHLAGIHNLKKIFNKTWSYMKFEKRLVPKKIALGYLNRALDGEDGDELSYEIAGKYFRK